MELKNLLKKDYLIKKDPKLLRQDFPFLKEAIYLDSAASMLKPISVIKAISDFYSFFPVNPHNIASPQSLKLKNIIDETRFLVSSLLEAKVEEIIFTSSATDSLNKIANMLEQFLNPNDQILVSYYSHISNILPFMALAKRTKSQIVFSNNILKDINSQTKIVAYAQVNNTLQVENDVDKIWQKSQEVGAFVINDAAQAIVHELVSLKKSHIVVFSGNKLYGPTGIGVLAIQAELLKKLTPTYFGGGQISQLTLNDWTLKEDISRFEPGTPNTAGIVGLNAAIKYFLENVDFEHEKKLAIYAYDQLIALPGLISYSKRGDFNILFNYQQYHAHDVVTYLAKRKILLRAGYHCVLGAENYSYNIFPNIRLSLGGYNIQEDIDALIKVLKEGGDFIDLE